MKVIEWLQSGDDTLKNLVDKNLLNQEIESIDSGLIDKYLKLYDKSKKMWTGIYSPLWTSSFYTLLELKYMEIEYNNQVYQEAALEVLNELWFNKGFTNGKREQDMCMSAMLLSILTYGRFQDERIKEIIDYILKHQLVDGGWNCAWNSVHNKSNKGSIHTTISCLEALRDYEKYGYKYRLVEIKNQVLKGEEFILKRDLYKNSQGNAIYKDMINFHYPTRWKYDCFRGLEYFSSVNKPYDERMSEAITFVKEQMKKGYITTGKQYPEKIHFKLEDSIKGRFNTYRALLILKQYDKEEFERILEYDFKY